MTTINSLDDFLRALDENPSWREAVRARILGEELLQLPVRFNAFVEEQRTFNQEIRSAVEEIRSTTQELRGTTQELRTFNEQQKAFNEEQRVFNEEQRTWNRNATARFNRMEGDISTIKDFYANSQPVRDVRGICGDLGLEFVRILSLEDLMRMAGNSLPRDVNRSFRNADLVIEATDGAETSYIVMEISFTADSRDTDRAIRNAELITRFTGNYALASIGSARNTNEVTELIESGGIYWYPVRDHAGRDTDFDMMTPQ